jgi:RNA polymerase sigma-70 factor (ECF subfamily)
MNSLSDKNVEAIWIDYHDKLLGFIRKRVKDKTTAEDILQDVFIKILDKIDTQREDSKILSWMYQMTKNTIVDYYRTNNRINDLPESLIEEDVNSESQLDEMKKCLMPVLNGLEEKYKEAFVLTEIEGISQKELASKLNTIKNTFTKYCSFHYDFCGNVIGYDASCDKC